jgi:hypothetical protein
MPTPHVWAAVLQEREACWAEEGELFKLYFRLHQVMAADRKDFLGLQVAIEAVERQRWEAKVRRTGVASSPPALRPGG